MKRYLVWPIHKSMGRTVGKPQGCHELRLYVAGTGPRSLRAVQNVKRICEAELAGHYNLEIIDLYKQPGRAKEDQIVALPTLIKQAPGAIRRLVGDLSQDAEVRKGLGLAGAV